MLLWNQGLRPGDASPDFDRFDETGARHRRSDHAGRWLAVFFYPRDNTPTCVREACAFNDFWDEFQALGADVLGCSTQDAASHIEMRRACRLRYPLLCDPDRTMHRAWKLNAWGGLRPVRATFLVGPDGTIRFVHRDLLRGPDHAQLALEFLKGAR